MSLSANEDAVLSREELDALLEEIPKLWSEGAGDVKGARSRVVDVELQRANESFAIDQGLLLSNRHQRVISLSLIGHREIEMPELAELMLPTDLVVLFRISPKSFDGFLLLSRPFFFHLLSMDFGSGTTVKSARPPTRNYTRIERRFYERATQEMLKLLESAWQQLRPIELEWMGLSSRAAVSESMGLPAILATFDVKGFPEACRLRVAIPAEPFSRKDAAGGRASARSKSEAGVSVLTVPLELRAQVGTTQMSLAEVGELKPGVEISLDTPSDGSLTITIGGTEKFKGIAGTQGGRRAVQLGQRIDGTE